MKFLKSVWLSNGAFFDWVQRLCNGNFWDIFQKKFGRLLKRKHVLDLGCGTGALAHYINPKSYTGIDQNPSYLAHARRTAHNTHAIFLRSKVTDALPPGSFDVAVAVSIFHHLSDRQGRTLLENLRRQHIRQLLIMECEPKHLFRPLLLFFDRRLGGGEFFRSQRELRELVSSQFRVKKEGIFHARNSLYTYPFLVLEVNQSAHTT